jgi:ABC-type multidrug transport system fused ATPase/permease subunit
MHFEVPKAKTFKEFGGEYLMIVISILTALALEHGVQTLHHRHLAHEASEKMEAELRENIGQVNNVLAYNEPKRQALEKVRDQMQAAIRGKTTEAWEAAVANQAVTWMPREGLERYASVYGWIRDTSTLAHNGSLAFLDGPRLRDVMSNVQMGSSNPQEIFRTVNQLIDAYNNLDDNLKALNTLMQQVVAEPGGAHGGPGA